MSTSTLITIYQDGMNYLWDSITGFFYTANAKDFIVVFMVLICVVTLVIIGIKYIFGRK